MTLVDTNILIDIVGNDPIWLTHSASWLGKRRSFGPLLINEIVYAELAGGFTTQVDLDDEIARLGLTHSPLTRAALFRAGQAFRKYRRAGGPRTNILADFFVGAHASTEGWPVLTRDSRRYRAYFPEVALFGA